MQDSDIPAESVAPVSLADTNVAFMTLRQHMVIAYSSALLARTPNDYTPEILAYEASRYADATLDVLMHPTVRRD